MAKSGLLACAIWLLCVVPTVAHHPFSEEFDKSKPVTLTGTVTRVEWENPHVFTYIDVKDAAGKMVNWKIEMGSPAALMKEGWSSTSVKLGNLVTVKGWAARNAANVANADSFTIGGKTMTAASSLYALPEDQLARATPQDAEPVATSGRQLPATATNLLLYGLLGALSLAGGFGLRMMRR